MKGEKRNYGEGEKERVLQTYNGEKRHETQVGKKKEREEHGEKRERIRSRQIKGKRAEGLALYFSITFLFCFPRLDITYK